MAMRKYAQARVTHPAIEGAGWDKVRVAAKKARLDRSLVTQTEEILGQSFDPTQYLLSHCTIVASVDCDEVGGVKLGKTTEKGRQLVRKTSKYRIRPECSAYVNNNGDAWERAVLLKSYKTLAGGFSFVEHVQIEELAKGRIIDAVARDVGPSVYVDILVANELKHKDLIRDIKSGKLNTLSMGCTIDGSTCSYCGNWAADETEMCEHIRFQKSNRFYDETGKQRIIAELCGDESLDPTGGVTFIEASWVEVPAFKGAVARNIVQLTEGDSRTAREVQRVYSLPVPTARPLGRPVAASLLRGAGEEFYDGEVPAEGEAPAEAPAAAPANPFADLEEDLRNQLVDRVRTRLKDELGRDQLQRQLAPSDAPNDTIVKQAAARPYRAALRTLVATSARPQDLVARIAKLNSEMGIFVPGSVYLTALKVGAVSRAASVTEYLGRCAELLGRKPTKAEAKTLIRLGSLLAAHNKRSKQKTTP